MTLPAKKVSARPTREEIISEVANPTVEVDDTDALAGFLGPDAAGTDDSEVMNIASAARDARISRSAETRDTEVREGSSWLPRTSLPDPDPEPGWVFRWVRVGWGAKGGDDVSNVMARLREGWVVVRPEDQPNIARTLPRNGEGQDRIVIGEVMLAKFPEDYAKQRRAYYNKKSRQQALGVQSQLLNMQDARMPLLKPSIVSTNSKRMEG